MLISTNKDPRPSMTEAVRATCFDCTAMFYDGRRDCLRPHCPLHPRMPYRTTPSNLSWLWGTWSEKHRNKLPKLNMTADEYIHTVITVGKLANGAPKYKISFNDMIRAKCFWCCGDYNQGGVDLVPLKQVSVRVKGKKKPIVRTEKAKGPFAIIKRTKHKIIIDNGEAGKIECGIRECPLYWWTPYRKQSPLYSWMFENDYTKKHRLAISALRITEDEYIHRALVEKSL